MWRINQYRDLLRSYDLNLAPASKYNCRNHMGLLFFECVHCHCVYAWAAFVGTNASLCLLGVLFSDDLLHPCGLWTPLLLASSFRHQDLQGILTPKPLPMPGTRKKLRTKDAALFWPPIRGISLASFVRRPELCHIVLLLPSYKEVRDVPISLTAAVASPAIVPFIGPSAKPIWDRHSQSLMTTPTGVGFYDGLNMRYKLAEYSDLARFHISQKNMT